MTLRACPIVLAMAGALCASVGPASGAPKTVCTITVNSADEAAAFRRALPAGEYRFVELVARGEADWLQSACRSGVACDVLLISGHYDGEGMFFSDQVERAEHLPVAALERAACSESCPGLFAQLKQVYLFGCNTLASAPVNGTGTLVASVGTVPGDAPLNSTSARHGESSRARMTRIFKDVPVLYGFASTAPVGAVAGDVLARWLRAGGTAEVVARQPSPRLLAHFSAHGMTSARGIDATDPRMAQRRDVCRFVDERVDFAQRTRFVHQMLARDLAEVRTYLDHLERFARELGERTGGPDLDAIAADTPLRERYLERVRALDDAPLRARLVALAHALRWIDDAGRQAEWGALLARRLASGAQPADVDLACRLGGSGALASQLARLRETPARDADRDAMLACLGDVSARPRVLARLADADAHDAELAGVLLRHQPPRDAAERGGLARAIARASSGPQAQERALRAIAGPGPMDAQGAAALVELFATARLPIQRAVAGVLVRADLAALDVRGLAATLVSARQPSHDGRDIIDVLIRRLTNDVAATTAGAVR